MENQNPPVDGTDVIDLSKLFAGEILENKPEERNSENTINDSTLFGTPVETQTQLSDQKTEAKPTEEKVVEKKDSKFSEFMSSYFGNDVEVEIENKNGELVKVKPSDLSPEDAIELIKQQVKSEIEEATKDKISTKGLSDIVAAMIEIDKKGGDISKLLQVQQKVVNPLQNINMSTEDGQREMILLDLSLKAYNQKDAQDLLELWESKGELEDRARSANESVESAVQALAENEKNKAIAEEEERKKAIKGYKVEVKKALDSFTLKDTYKAKLIDILVEPSQDGKFKINDLFVEALQNPEKASKLALFLENTEEYDRQVSSKQVIEERLKDGKTLKLMKRETTEENTPAKPIQEGVISFDNL